MKRLFPIALMIVLYPLPSYAQQPAKKELNPVAAAARQLLERQSKNLVAAAEEMPSEKYDFRPTPPQMTFARLVLHTAESNDFLCSKISDTPEPQAAKLSDTDPKEKLVQALKSSFDYCATALAPLEDSKLADTITFLGGRQVSRALALFALTNDWADHYGAAATYLRLNGLLPPTAQPRKP